MQFYESGKDLYMLFGFYERWVTLEEVFAKYGDLMEGIAGLKFVAGYGCHQLTDIEQEINGDDPRSILSSLPKSTRPL
jgi:hypothetical protein